MCSLGLADEVYTKCLESSKLLKPVHRACRDLWFRVSENKSTGLSQETPVFRSWLIPDRLCDFRWAPDHLCSPFSLL